MTARARLYTPGDEYRHPQYGVKRVGFLRWEWQICIENRISITGRAFTNRGAAKRAHRLAVDVIPRRRDVLSPGEYVRIGKVEHRNPELRQVVVEDLSGDRSLPHGTAVFVKAEP